MTALAVPTIEVMRHGDIPTSACELATKKIGALLARFASTSVLHARVRLIRETNPSIDRPAIAKASVDVQGRHVNAHVAAKTFPEAVDLLELKLSDQLEHAHRRLDARQHDPGVPTPGEWRHGDLSAHRPDWFNRPVEEREIIAHKTYATPPITIEEAAFDLDVSESEFWLFVDAGTGRDSVLRRISGGAFELSMVDPPAEGVSSGSAEVRVAPAPPPTLSPDGARSHLDVSGKRFVFFADAGDGRGKVLYHRYDGHYGLVAPAP